MTIQYYSSSGSLSTSYYSTTPVYTYNSDGTKSTMTITFSDGTYIITKWTYTSSGTYSVSTTRYTSSATTTTTTTSTTTSKSPVMTYNTDGSIATLTVYNSDGSYYIITYTYNTGGSIHKQSEPTHPLEHILKPPIQSHLNILTTLMAPLPQCIS